jgi:hypothetical protein
MTAEFLDRTADVEEGTGRRLIGEIEARERELVNLRDHRDDAFRRAAELRTAANILRDVGLRSETTPSGPFVALDYVPKRPAVATPGPQYTEDDPDWSAMVSPISDTDGGHSER